MHIKQHLPAKDNEPARKGYCIYKRHLFFENIHHAFESGVDLFKSTVKAGDVREGIDGLGVHPIERTRGRRFLELGLQNVKELTHLNFSYI